MGAKVALTENLGRANEVIDRANDVRANVDSGKVGAPFVDAKIF